MKRTKVLRILWIMALAGLLLPGCATNLTKPAHEPQPTKVRFSEFKKVEMKAVGVGEKFDATGANQRAVRKIDQVLFQNMKKVFPELVRIEQGQDFTPGPEQTLEITPVVKEIKFVSGGSRFWVGAMAGSSAVLMQVTYRDSASGEVVADPEFYRAANAYSGGWSVGVTDNKMLEDIANDAVQYTRYNQ